MIAARIGCHWDRASSRPATVVGSVLGQQAAAPSRRGVAEAVVAIGAGLVVGRELGIGIEARGVLELLLVVPDADMVTRHRGAGHRYQRELLADQPALDRYERGLVTLRVIEDVLELADLLAGRVDDVLAPPVAEVLDRQ